MGWLAWQGTTSAPGESLLRLVVATVAVVIALLGLSLEPTASARSDRTAAAMLPMAPTEQRTSGVRIAQTDDYFRGESLRVRTVATVGPVPDDLPWTIPARGELVASPRLAQLLAHDEVLAERYPGEVIDSVDDAALLGPRDLVLWRGVDPADLPPEAGWLVPDGPRMNSGVAGMVPTELRFAVPLIIVGFVVPLLALLALVSTLGAARREQRLAAMRLVGLTDVEARATAVLESLMLSATSCLLGYAAFRLLVPVVAPRIPVEAGVWPADVVLPAGGLAVLLVGFPLLSALANWLGLRTLATSPLGVEKRSSVRSPSRWALLPASLGVALLGVVLSGALDDAMVRSRILLLAGILVTLGVAGVLPFAARGLSALAVRRARGLASLVAARRVAADPAQATRASVGVALLVAVSGPLLVFFPLIADSAAADLQRLGEQVGSETLVATVGPASLPEQEARARDRALRGAVERDRVGDLMALDLVPMTTTSGADRDLMVGFVDCALVQRYTGVPTADCSQGLTVPGRGSVPLDLEVAAYREVQRGAQGRVVRRVVGDPVSVATRPQESAAVATLLAGLSTSADVLLPRELADGRVPTAGYTRFVLARPHGEPEEARTDLVAAGGGEVLSVGERHAIATRTTREFRLIAAAAALLTVVVAGLATLITSYEQIRRGTAERRLLWISGADTALARRVLWWQNVAPAALAVLPAAALSLALARALVDLVDREAVPTLPVLAVALVAGVALLTTTLATQLLTRFARFDRITLTEE